MYTMKCKICNKGLPRFAPELRASGYAPPKDLKCPICDTLHNGSTGKTLEEWEQDGEQRVVKTREGILADPEYYLPDLWDI